MTLCPLRNPAIIVREWKHNENAMHLIVCIDECDGMSFCGRRQSRDSEVFAHMLRIADGVKLWMSAYSAPFFAGTDVAVDEDFQRKAGAGEYCFVETDPLLPTYENLESVVLYYWNRTYPSTMKVPRSLLDGMHLECTEEFAGRSHERITMERFTR